MTARRVQLENANLPVFKLFIVKVQVSAEGKSSQSSALALSSFDS